MKPERWVHNDDRERIVPVRGAVFDRGSWSMAGTNVLVGDAAARFLHGDSVDVLAADYDVPRETIEAAIRTVLRAGKRYP